MNDEQFEAVLDFIRRNWNSGGNPVAELRSRDTAQREAVESWRAAHARESAALAQAWEQCDTARAQLAEAVGLLREFRAKRMNVPASLCEETDAFFARHAQAEQQQAHLAETVRESLRPENQRIEPVGPLRVPHPLEAQGAQAGDEWDRFVSNYKGRGWKELDSGSIERGAPECTVLAAMWQGWFERAALATQPAAPVAAGEPVAKPRVIAWMRYDSNRDRWAFSLSKRSNDSQALYLHPTSYVITPPAAAHGACEPIGTLHRDADTQAIRFDPIGDPHIKDGMPVYAALATQAADGEHVRVVAEPGEELSPSNLVGNRIDRMLTIGTRLYTAPVAAGDPVAWQQRDLDDVRWRSTDRQHHEDVQTDPESWPGHETRALFAGVPPAAAHGDEALNQALTRVQELEALINTPHTDEWFEAVRLEAAHQVERWGASHDVGKAPADWFWLLGYLGQKAMTAAMAGNENKARHHTISSAAMLLNWFRAIVGDSNAMRPGIDAAMRAQAGEGDSNA